VAQSNLHALTLPLINLMFHICIQRHINKSCPDRREVRTFLKLRAINAAKLKSPILYISNIKCLKPNIMCEINNGGEMNEKSRNHYSWKCVSNPWNRFRRGSFDRLLVYRCGSVAVNCQCYQIKKEAKSLKWRSMKWLISLGRS
jgi:hypothetical protein